MSLNIRYLTNGEKTAYQVVNRGVDPTEITFYENKEDIPESIVHYAPEGEPNYIEPDLAYILDAQDYFYPNFQKCGKPEYEGRRCIAESCKYSMYNWKNCEYAMEEAYES